MITKYLSVNNLTKFNKFLASNLFLTLACGGIILFSIFINSLTDIGPDSGIYLELGRKFANGGKYYDQIFESNFPLNFYIYALEYKIHLLTAINYIIVSQIFIYLFFLLSFFCSQKIVKKTTFYDNKIFVNFLFLFFCLAFFLRYPSITLNEMGTKSSFFMLLFFPYLLYSFRFKLDLSKTDLIFRGLLMGLIPCFKPHYLIPILIIEFFKFFDNRNWKFIFRLDHLLLAIIGLAMLNWMIFFEKEYFLYMVPMWKLIYDPYRNYDIFINRTFSLLSFNYSLHILAVFMICASRIDKFSYNLKLIATAYFATLLMLLTEGLISYDQLSNLYFILFFFLLFIFSDSKVTELINISKNKFIFLSLIIISLFEYSAIQNIIFSSYSIYWSLILLAPFFAIYYFIQKKINLKDLIEFFIISLLSIISVIFFINQHNIPIVAILIIFCSIIICVIYERKINCLTSPNFSPISFTFIIAVPIMIFFNITNSVNMIFKSDSTLSSPYDYSDKLHYYIKKFAPDKNDHFINFAKSEVMIKYPLYNYLDKVNKIKSASHFYANYKLTKNYLKPNANIIYTPSDNNIFLTDQFFYNQIVSSLADESYKLIFINYNSQMCEKNFLEFLINVPEFERLFKKNFYYVDTLYSHKNYDSYQRNTNFEINKKKYKLIGDKYNYMQIEIYARKNKI